MQVEALERRFVAIEAAGIASGRDVFGLIEEVRERFDRALREGGDVEVGVIDALSETKARLGLA